MAKESKYGLNSLKKDFPTDEACLEFIFDSLHTRECSCGGHYSLIKGRKQYQCSKCRFQIAPAAGTIFHKSDTPLILWFHALWVFSNAKSGISAKEMERQLEVTYKTAWRMLKLIREALGRDFPTPLRGIVEVDTAFIGGKGDAGDNNEQMSRAMASKAVVMGAVQRGGYVQTKVVKGETAAEYATFLAESVDPEGTRLMTDSTSKLHNVAMGYERYMVDHHRKEYVRGDVYVNTMESFWGHVKRSIKGTHKVVSKKHLQSYLNGFSFHWNNRGNDRARFAALLGIVVLGGVV